MAHDLVSRKYFFKEKPKNKYLILLINRNLKKSLWY